MDQGKRTAEERDQTLETDNDNQGESPSTKETRKRTQKEQEKTFPKQIPKETKEILKDKGITELFPIQQQCFDPLFNGKDLIGSDHTGSGKTLAYCLPLLESLRANQLLGTQNPKVLILAPVRELATQVHAVLQQL